MSIDDTPSVKHMRQQLNGFKQLLRLPFLPMSRKQYAELRTQIGELSAQVEELIDYRARFNRALSRDGWLANNSLPVPVMKQVVEAYETSGAEAATALLLDFYKSDNLAGWVHRLKGVEELQVRSRFIRLALEDYRAERYHSVVPLLIMVMDGAVNDAAGKGLHSTAIDLEVWDSFTTADGAINDIKEIFQKSRKKTRAEPIKLPYRHGILHGMDLSFDNAVVAAKCWCFLFVVADWIASKKSEPQRREKFQEDTRIPAMAEILHTYRQNETRKRAVDEWKPREIAGDYLEDLNRKLTAEPGTPEHAALQFLRLMRDQNYGHMAEMYAPTFVSDPKRHAGDLRMQLGHLDVDSYSIDDIVDQGPAITEVYCSLNRPQNESLRYGIRMVCQSASGEPSVRGLQEGKWYIVSISPRQITK